MAEMFPHERARARRRVPRFVPGQLIPATRAATAALAARTHRANPNRPHRDRRRRRNRCVVLRHDLADGVVKRLVGPGTDHEDRTRAGPGADEHVAGAGRTIEVVPTAAAGALPPRRSVRTRPTTRGSPPAPPRSGERVRVARPEDAEVDAHVLE